MNSFTDYYKYYIILLLLSWNNQCLFYYHHCVENCKYYVHRKTLTMPPQKKDIRWSNLASAIHTPGRPGHHTNASYAPDSKLIKLIYINE